MIGGFNQSFSKDKDWESSRGTRGQAGADHRFTDDRHVIFTCKIMAVSGLI